MTDDIRPVMNDTKWRELIAEMRDLQAAGWGIQHHAKELRGPWPSPCGWDGDFFHHLCPWNTLEWVDIRCSGKHGSSPLWRALDDQERQSIYLEIGQRLAKHSIPFSVEEGYIRVWGYTRPGQAIAWQQSYSTAKKA